MKVSRVKDSDKEDTKKKGSGEEEISEEERKKILQDAKAAGLASMITGAGLYAASTKKALKLGAKAAKDLKWDPKKYLEYATKSAKTARTAGLGLGITGAGLLGTSAYISYKDKKKKEKENNDSAKK